jgi:hypothetical protein
MGKTTPLTAREEEILRTVRYYRYITTQDILTLYFAPGSKKYAQALMASLAGNKDLGPRSGDRPLYTLVTSVISE